MLHLYTPAPTQTEQICPESTRNLTAISVIEEGSQLKQKPFKFSAQQLDVLLRKYEESQCPSREERGLIANDIGVSAIRVNRWFTDRRHRERKKMEISKKCKYKFEIQTL